MRKEAVSAVAFLSCRTLWAEKIQSTIDAGSLNTFGRNEIEVAPISSVLLRIACLVILFKTCRVPDQELAADGILDLRLCRGQAEAATAIPPAQRRGRGVVPDSVCKTENKNEKPDTGISLRHERQLSTLRCLAS